MSRFFVVLSLFLYLGGCSTSEHWFETKSWFNEKEIESGAPNYIPIAAVPDIEELEKSSPAIVEKKKTRLGKKKVNKNIEDKSKP